MPAKIDALDRLRGQLQEDAELFQACGDGGRTGAFRALQHVLVYLMEKGISSDDLRPLQAVFAGLMDAENGVQTPMFKPTRAKGGKPPKPVDNLFLEGKLGIVIECCVQHYRAQHMRPYVRPAAQLAAKMINQSTWPIRVTARQLEEIRERVSQSPASSLDRIELEEVRLDPAFKQKPLAWAESFLKTAWVGTPPKVSAKPHV